VRKKWPGCVHSVRNQGDCGSCWAEGCTETLSDRFCVASKGKINVSLSVQELVSCNDYGLEACNGGEPVTAFTYTSLYGLPLESCFPYVSGNHGYVPSCRSSCIDSNQPFTLYYSILDSIRWHITVDAAEQDMITNGPTETCFDVYEDFMYYQSGVYEYKTGDFLGGHCVQFVGWNVTSSGEEYWIVRNSWGTDWGLSGYFWIKKGVNECGIEDRVFSALPSL